MGLAALVFIASYSTAHAFCTIQGLGRGPVSAAKVSALQITVENADALTECDMAFLSGSIYNPNETVANLSACA